MAQSVEPWLLEILVCPESKAKLLQVGDWLYSTDPATRRRFAIKEGIPNMLLDESEVVSEDAFREVMKQCEAKVK